MTATLRRILTASTFIALVPAAAPAATTVAIVSRAQAPMDRYFGKLGMSPLGVINSIKFVSDREDANLIDPPSAIGRLVFSEDSLRAWERAFPYDSWLPAMIVRLKVAYHRLDGPDARAHEAAIDYWLATRYANAPEARAALAAPDDRQGFADARYAVTAALETTGVTP